MKNLSLLLDNGKNEVYLERFIRTGTDSKMEVRNAAVYWNFKNITKSVNDTIKITATLKNVTFEDGYWTFHMMAEKLAESDVKLVRNRYDNTCEIFPKDTDEGLGPMLGFSENATVRSNTWTNSFSNIDVNLGLRTFPSNVAPWTPTETLIVTERGARSSPPFPSPLSRA